MNGAVKDKVHPQVQPQSEPLPELSHALVKPGKGCLMHGMADRMGVDVARAATGEVISQSEAEDMVTRCGNCTQHDACIIWLLEHQNRIEQPPAYCLNTQELQYLRMAQSAPNKDETKA